MGSSPDVFAYIRYAYISSEVRTWNERQTKSGSDWHGIGFNYDFWHRDKRFSFCLFSFPILITVVRGCYREESYKIERKGKEVSTHILLHVYSQTTMAPAAAAGITGLFYGTPSVVPPPSPPPSKNGLYSFSPFSDGREGGGGRKKDTRTHSSWGLGRGRGGGPKKRRLSILWQCWVSRGEGGRGVLPIKRRFLACRKKKKGSPVSPPDRRRLRP